jgi:plastocyanin
MAPSPTTPAPTTPTTPAYLIEIQNLAFNPLVIDVAPGSTVTIRNLDSMGHSVTSQSAPSTFASGAASGIQFDTGIFTGADQTITIPANAPNGAMLSYFCMHHTSAMATPNGTIHVTTTPVTTMPTTPTTPMQPSGPGY